MLKAVLFDMDDTLLDWSQRSEDWPTYERKHLNLVYDYIVGKANLEGSFEVFLDLAHKLNRKAWFDSDLGLQAPIFIEILESAVLQFGAQSGFFTQDELLRAYDPRLFGGVTPFPDVHEILPILRANVEIGVITNAALPMWVRDLELEACGLLEHMGDCRLTAADVGYLKPHPAVFEAALTQLGASADEVVFVGDNPEADIAGAQNVGMKAVLRVTRNQPLISGLIIPDGAINTLHELLPLLDEWYPGWRKTV